MANTPTDADKPPPQLPAQQPHLRQLNLRCPGFSSGGRASRSGGRGTRSGPNLLGQQSARCAIVAGVVVIVKGVVFLFEAALLLVLPDCYSKELPMARMAACVRERPDLATEDSFRKIHVGRWLHADRELKSIASLNMSEDPNPAPEHLNVSVSGWTQSGREDGDTFCTIALVSHKQTMAYRDAMLAELKIGKVVNVIGQIADFNDGYLTLEPCIVSIKK